MTENTNKFSRSLPTILVVITCISLALMIPPTLAAQPTYNSQVQLSAGSLLNKPGISYDLSILDEFMREGSVNILYDLGSGTSFYIYRCHFHENLSVLIFEIEPSDLSINESKKDSIDLTGLSVNIVIPTEIGHDGLEQVLIPAVNIDPETFEWGSALRAELAWLQDLSIINGLTPEDLDQIVMMAKHGQEDFLSMALYDNKNTTWIQYLMPDDILTLDDTFGELPFHISIDDIPPKTPGEYPYEGKPAPDEETHYSAIVAAIIVLVMLGTFSYSRLKRRSILDNLNRKNIFEHVKANPGVHFKKLLRELGFQPGALSYHLNVLEKEEFIKSIQDSNYRRFYLYGTKSDFKIILTTIQLRILSVVNERPGITQSKISRAIGKNRMLVHYHIKILVDAGIISLEKSGRESLCFTTDNASPYL